MKSLVFPSAAFKLALLSLCIAPVMAQTTPTPPPGCVNPVCKPKEPCPQYICPIIHSQITSILTDGRFHLTF